MNGPQTFIGGVLGVSACLLAAGCATRSNPVAEKYESEQRQIAAHLNTFDDLDFNVFTNRKWTELHRSHANNITVYWPDGHTTIGIEKHIEDLKAMFVWAPDTRIKEHPVKMGQGEWTSVIGTMEGTFTKPMPIGAGKSIPPTGKAYKIRMVTVGHWNKDGVMDAEYLMWDNQEFMKEIGLGEGTLARRAHAVKPRAGGSGNRRPER
jgi:hypothetical protein